MEKILILVLILLSFWTNANTLDVSIEPNSPVIGESFNLLFKISGSDDEVPEISFNPRGVDVLGRSNRGVSIQTTYINGRYTTNREVTYAYELVANKAGIITISDIHVKIGNTMLKHNSLSVQVLSSPLKNPDVFIMAVPDKTTVFAGEGFVVRYYLYKKIQVVNEEIIEFPKLDKFLKRFLKSTARSERVTFNNDIYIRDERYAAKLFASKEGNYSIDPIKYRVQYGVSAHGGPFGNLGIGFGLQNIKSKNLSSKPIKIKVIPLPIENVPKSFTGLVGRHNFKLKLNKSKFLVNEVIETKLVVSGDGALELFEAPKIFNDLAFEEFETKVNLEISPTGFGNKTFDYTYLARKQVDVPGREIPFTYFDPETGQYVTSKVTLDGVTVVGGNIGSGTKGNTQVSKESDTNESEKTKPVEGSQIVAPIFSFNDYNSNTLKQINIGLGILVFLFLGMGLLAPLRKKRNLKNGEATVKKIQANGIQYSDLYNLLILLDGSGQNGRHNFSSLVNTIEHANISNDCKKYFLDLIESCTESNFKTHTDIKFTYNNNYFKEVLDQINVKKKKNKNGNSFESARA